MTFAEQEQQLSHWMAENAFVAWTVHPTPWQLEHELIAALTLPLNLDKNKRCAFHPKLTELGRYARREGAADGGGVAAYARRKRRE